MGCTHAKTIVPCSHNARTLTLEIVSAIDKIDEIKNEMSFLYDDDESVSRM